MEIYVSEQLRTFVLSVCLGFALGGLYDMVGAVRCRWRSLTWLLDGGYCLWVVVAMFLFTLREARGELRLFVILGAMGGATLFFTGFSPWLRPVWSVWLDVVTDMWAVLTWPMVTFVKLGKFFLIWSKNTFYFCGKYSTMKQNYHIPKKGRHDIRGKEKKSQCEKVRH